MRNKPIKDKLVLGRYPHERKFGSIDPESVLSVAERAPNTDYTIIRRGKPDVAPHHSPRVFVSGLVTSVSTEIKPVLKIIELPIIRRKKPDIAPHHSPRVFARGLVARASDEIKPVLKIIEPPIEDTSLVNQIVKSSLDMTGITTLSLIMFIRDISVSYLDYSLYTLCNQSRLPEEIILVNMNTGRAFRDRDDLIASKYPIVRVVYAQDYRMNISLANNIGIQEASSKYVMTVQSDLLYSKGVIANVCKLLGPDRVIESGRGNIPEGKDIGPANSIHKRWGKLMDSLVSPRQSMHTKSPGTVIAFPRDWLMGVHGFDEVNTPYAYNDTDLLFRASRCGFKSMLLPWDKCQVLHIDHPVRYAFYAVPSKYPSNNEPIIANPNRWGNYGR